MISAEALMRLAIEKCRQGLVAGQSPFGCAIARQGQVIAVEHNTVLATLDSTAHAEINAIRAGCRAARDVHLTGAVVATTCEPCPMCLAALHWAQVEAVYFGAAIADAQEAGFNELCVPAADLASLGGSPLRLVPGLLTAECCALFAEWRAGPSPRTY